MAILSKLRPSAALFLTSALLATTAQGEPITLLTPDRSMAVSGELISFDGKTYVLRGLLGVISLDASKVICDGVDCPSLIDQTRFSIVGSSAIGEGLMPELIRYFALMQDMTVTEQIGADDGKSVFVLTTADGEPYVEITVAPDGEDTVVDALVAGEAQIGMLTVPFTEEQRTALTGEKEGAAGRVSEYVVALDGLGFVVSPGNPVDSLTGKQIAGIYSGKITNWSEVGGPNLEIRPYMLARDMGESSHFTGEFLAPDKLDYADSVTEVANNEELNARVSSDPAAIAFTGMGGVNGGRVLSLQGECGIYSTPTDFALRAEEYPLSQRFYIVSGGAERSGPVQAFLDFVRTDEAQAAVAAAGYVDDLIGIRAVNGQGNRLLNMILTDQETVSFNSLKTIAKELRGATRVSTTFRFGKGFSRLDERGSRDLLNLADFLRERDMTGKEVLVLGFTDSFGSARTNVSLSARRAKFIVDALHEALGDDGKGFDIVSKGFGEASPLDCNSTEQGRETNRRVEIWIRDAR